MIILYKYAYVLRDNKISMGNEHGQPKNASLAEIINALSVSDSYCLAAESQGASAPGWIAAFD